MGTLEDYKNRKAERENRKREATARKGFRRPDWVAAFTFCLVCVGLLQAMAFIQSERAFVSPSAMKFTPATEQNKTAYFDMQIRNSGRSTADLKHNVYTISPQLKSDPNYPALTEITLSPVVPGGFIQFQIKVDSLDSEHVKGLSGAYPFFIYGLIEYGDDFSLFGYKKSGWCFQYVPNSRDPQVSQFDSCNNQKYTYSR